jgi:hypothetical protein
MAALFGLPAENGVGSTFADPDYGPDLASLLNGDIDQVFTLD